MAPTYAWRLSHLFEEWLSKCQFNGSNKAYFVLNCGSGIAAAAKYIKKWCVSNNMEYMGTAKILMPENYIALFSAPNDKKDKEIILKGEKKCDLYVAYIREKSKFEDVSAGLLGHTLSGIVNTNFYKHTIKDKKFYVTDKCISCGN